MSSEGPLISIRETTRIEATTAEVWDRLARLDTWVDWNHVVPDEAGPPVAGEEMTLTLPGPGGRPIRSRVQIVEVVPQRSLVWRGGVPGLFTAVHGFTLEAEDDATLLVHHEAFHGLLAGLVLWLLGSRDGSRHRDVNARLKAVVEAG